jgi:hypothetical protein
MAAEAGIDLHIIARREETEEASLTSGQHRADADRRS